jgi:hypothetical protein
MLGPSTAPVPAFFPMQAVTCVQSFSGAVRTGELSWMMSLQPVVPAPSSFVKRW